MKTPLRLLLALIVLPLSVFALSRTIGRDIEFPKGYDPARAAAIRAVIQDEQFKFVDGTVSYWPPDWGTRLSFEGDANSLNNFLTRIRKLDGIVLKVILFKGQDTERRRDSPWQLDFSHAHPQQLTVYVNLNAKGLELEEVQLPEWKVPQPQ